MKFGDGSRRNNGVKGVYLAVLVTVKAGILSSIEAQQDDNLKGVTDDKFQRLWCI